ncbi:PepSY domain-containing protein [Ottowia testudinis]|uniref:PepSY domain-containing protein n=1 Tax=Ottowia testudinis TaxID=2816950 RepID=A0A975CG27_9BURK|nr:PepSY domain-containing protein [Ottowia testudinis]QTD45126.1 PepSY domain-containing protein [Ottowia testudinis]
MKRWLYLLHRWLGVLLALFMAMWFISGVVMMYVGYPKLDEAERLAALPPLDAARCCATEVQTLTRAPATLRGARLVSVAGAPRWVLTHTGREVRALDAVTGEPIATVTGAHALAAAQAFMPGVAAWHEGTLDEDAWTHSKALDAHRPLHRIQMADAAQTVLYVSSRSGEVVRDASRTERAWNWVGAWIHWLYPFRGGALDAYWHDIVVYGSIAATVLSLLGVLVGVWRWRFRGAYRGGAKTPYREGWMRWHHVLGLLFGLTTVTFIFSGLMSMNPFKVLDSGAPRLEQRLARAGGQLQHVSFTLPVREALQRFADDGLIVRELEWRNVAGQAYYLARGRHGQSALLRADGAGDTPVQGLDAATLRAWAQALVPEARVTGAEVLTRDDLYYYQREPHTMSGGSRPALPVLRVKFDDPHATWLHLDMRSGAVINQLDAHRRAGRWLFAFLHSWDWPALLALRPLWDAWMIALSVGGLLISTTGVVIGARRVARKWPFRAARAPQAHAA